MTSLAALATISSASAANLPKANDTDALNLGTAWAGGVVPGAGDVAQWDATVSNPNNTTNDLGANATWAGIKVLNPAGPAAITTNSGPATLTLAGAGIDMSSATVDFTMFNNVLLPDNTVQTWNVPPGRTLLLGGALTRSGGSVLNFNGGGTVNIAGGTPSSALFYSLVNGTDVGALDASGNLSTVASVIGYTPNPTTGVPATQYMDMVTPIGATGNDWYTSGSTTYFPRTVRFNQPQGSRNFWQLFGHNLILLNGANGTTTILVTTNVGACDVILTGDGSGGAAIGMRQTSGGSEFIFDQENTLGSLYINEGFSVKTASLAGNMLTKRGAGRVVVNADLWYAGRTRVLEGELQLNGGNRDNSVITVNPGATLSGNAVLWTGSLTNSGTLWPGIGGAGSMTVSNSLTLNAGSSLKFYNAGVAPGATAPLNVAGNLIVGGTVNISILSGLPAVGQYPLIRWTNDLTSVFPNFNLATLPVRTSGYLSNNITASTIDLVITNVGEPISWATGSGTWDINGAVNWKDVFGTSTAYQELSGAGDQVVFEDTQSGTSPITVTLNTNVHPSSVAFNSSKNFTVSGNGSIAGGTAVTLSGSGTFTLATINTYSGGTVLNGGTTVFSSLDNLGSGPITFGGGTLKYNGNADDISTRSVTLASGQSTIDIGAGTIVFANPIGNNGAGGFTKVGSGLLVLSGTNKYSGNTIVSQGTLNLNSATYISNSAAIMVNSGATLDAASSGVGLTFAGGTGQILGGSGTVAGNIISSNGIITPGTNGVVGTLTLANDLQLYGGTLKFDISATPGQSDLLVVGGGLLLSGGTVQLNVTGTLPNGRYKLIQYGSLFSGPGSAGTVAVTGFSQANKSAFLDDSVGGEIDLVIADSASDNLTWSGAGSTWDTAGTLDWLLGANPYSFTNGDFVTFDESGAANPNVNLQNAVTPSSVTVNNTTTTYAFVDGTGTGGGKITGNASITKKGSGTLIIATANNNSGPTDLEGGTLQIGNGGTLGDLGTGNVTNNSALVFNQADNHKVSGVISGTGSVTQQGSGVVTLTGNNTYSGPTTIASSGSLQVGNGGASGSLGSGVVTNDGTLIYNKSGTVTVGNIKAGPANGGALSFTGPATVTLNNGNTYINNTSIGNGLVKVAAADSIPSAATVPGSTGWLILDGGAAAAGTLDLNGFNINVNALSGLGGTFTGVITNSGTSTTTTNALTVLGTAGTTYNGIIADNASGAKTKLVLRGANELRLNANNTYRGGTMVGDSATIGFGPGASVGSGTLTLSNGTTLSMHSAGSSLAFPTPNVFIPDNATVTNFSTSLGNGFAGVITGSESTTNVLMASSGQGVSYSPSNLKQLQPFLGTLLIPSGQSLRWSPTSGLNNGGDFTTLDLEGTTYGRSSGTITFGAITGAGTIDNPSGGTVTWIIGGKNNDSTFSGTITDNATAHNALTKVGTGKLSLAGAINYSGATTVSNGVLALASDSVTLDNSPSITLSGDNATIDMTGHSDPTLYLGNLAPQVLNGFGVINGNLVEQVTTTNNLRPGVLRVTQTATINGALTMQINRTNAVNSAELSAPTLVNGGSITLTVSNVGSTNLVGGDKFQLFNQAFTGGFVATNLPALPLPGMYWTNNIAVDGSISVVSTVATNPTNLTMSVNGGVISLAWPADHQGWTLQQNTNLVSPNWQDVPGSTGINSTNITIDPNTPSIFYRLKL